MRRLARTLFGSEHRTLTLVSILLIVAVVVALGTGFWLLFRLAYVIGFAIPACWLLAWWNTRNVEATVERRTLRGQVGQEAVEVIEVRNRDVLPKIWVEAEDPSDLPGHRSRRVVIIPPRRSRIWLVTTKLTRRGL